MEDPDLEAEAKNAEEGEIPTTKDTGLSLDTMTNKSTEIGLEELNHTLPTPPGEGIPVTLDNS